MAYQAPTLPQIDTRGAVTALLQAGTNRGSLPGTLLGQYQDRRMKEEELAMRAENIKQAKANADRTYGLQEANAVRQSQQDEATATWRKSEQVNDLEKARLQKDYQNKILANAEAARLATEVERNRKIEVEQGEAQGQFLPIVNTQTSTGVEDVVDMNKAKAMYTDATSNIDAVSEDPIKQAYHEYRKANDSNYTASTFDKVKNAAIDASNLIPKGVWAGVKTIQQDSSEAAQFERDLAGKNAVPKGVKSYKEFSEGYVNPIDKTKEVKDKYDNMEKLIASKWVTGKESGNVTQKEVETVKDIPREDMLRMAYEKIQESGKSDNAKQGMMKAAAERINKVDERREAVATTQLKYAMDNMETAQKQAFQKELAAYKDKLGRNLTKTEQMDIAYKMKKMEALDQDIIKSKDSWF